MASSSSSSPSDTSINFQGFMEGGAEQGRRAARELARLIRGRDDGDVF